MSAFLCSDKHDGRESTRRLPGYEDAPWEIA